MADNFEMLIPPAQGRITLDRDGDLSDTIEVIKSAYRKSIPQMSALAGKLKRSSLESSARSVFEFMYQNIRYKRDTEGTEEVRTAARSWADREIGVDCEDLSIFAAALLTNMGYKPVFNIIAQNGNPYFSHIFVTVGDHPHPENSLVKGYVIDPVPPLTGFDELAKNISKNMRIQLLEGIEGLNGLGCPEKPKTILGLGGYAPVDTVTRALMRRQSNLLKLSRQKGLSGPLTKAYGKELRKNRLAIMLNGTPERDFVLDILPYVDDISRKGEYIFRGDAPLEAINEYLSNAIDLGLLEDDTDLDGLEFEDLNDDLGRKKKEERQQKKQERKEKKEEKKQERQQKKQEKKQQKEQQKTGLRKVFKKKTAEEKQQKKEKRAQKKADRKAKGPLLKRAGKTLKKIVKPLAKGIVRFNPVTIAARNGMLAAFRINLFKMSSKLKAGYLTEDQAKSLGLDMEEWRNTVNTLQDVEKIFVGIGGESKNLRNAIVKGGKGFGILSGYDVEFSGDIGHLLGELGVLPAEAAPAAGFIAKIVSLLKRINFRKLIGKAKNVAPEVAAELLSDEGNDVVDTTPSAEKQGFANEEEMTQFNESVEKTQVEDAPGRTDAEAAAEGGGPGSGSSGSSGRASRAETSESSDDTSGGSSGSGKQSWMLWGVAGVVAVGAIAFALKS